MPRTFKVFNFRPLHIADQAAEALRDSIRSGHWGGYLPGEHGLARQLGISRPTVHKALKTLAREGLISTSHGRRTRIISDEYPSEAIPAVCVVAPVSRAAVGLVENPLLLALRVQLTARGIRWDEFFDYKLAGKKAEFQLERLVSKRHGVCWLIVAGSALVQRWFEKSGLPTLVLGSCQPGVHLPSVDLDYHAVGWHAAGNITRLGHRHVTFIMRDHPLPGDLACRDGFLQYLKPVAGKNSLTVVTAGSNALDLQLKLERLLTHRPRPTVLFVMEMEHVQTVLMHLPRCGLRIPQDFSVVCGDSHPLFDMGAPELTRYRRTTENQLDQTIRLIQAQLSGNSPALKPHLIAPTFVAGKTLARPPAAFTPPG